MKQSFWCATKIYFFIYCPPDYHHSGMYGRASSSHSLRLMPMKIRADLQLYIHIGIMCTVIYTLYRDVMT